MCVACWMLPYATQISVDGMLWWPACGILTYRLQSISSEDVAYCTTFTNKAQECRRNLETIDEDIQSLRDEEKKQQAVLDALQISREDKSSLMDLQV